MRARATLTEATERPLWTELAALNIPTLVVRSGAQVPCNDDDWATYQRDVPRAELVEFAASPHDLFRHDRLRYPALIRSHVERAEQVEWVGPSDRPADPRQSTRSPHDLGLICAIGGRTLRDAKWETAAWTSSTRSVRSSTTATDRPSAVCCPRPAVDGSVALVDVFYAAALQAPTIVRTHIVVVAQSGRLD